MERIKGTLVVVVKDIDAIVVVVVVMVKDVDEVKWDHNDGKNDKYRVEKLECLCYYCGGKNHWSRNCPKHLVELYQQCNTPNSYP
ncbi:zinc knuckle domain containing protein [Gossypium australe]|uniref:Zinc knuckle domain containing protein n=1 Tax=Gossypium australe TaxID=47621 RepID=A0A5B6W7Z4_9ROSI|nr:zinc knuckle domain containing protein [Gossypium australe]